MGFEGNIAAFFLQSREIHSTPDSEVANILCSDNTTGDMCSLIRLLIKFGGSVESFATMFTTVATFPVFKL